MSKRIKLQLFSISLVFASIFWRLWVKLFYDPNTVSILRASTGLNIHHYHYGIIMVLIATFFLMFHKKTNLAIILAGFGFGTYFDGFISRLIRTTPRKIEIINYNQNFIPTTILFTFLILLTIIFYLFSEKYKNPFKYKKPNSK